MPHPAGGRHQSRGGMPLRATFARLQPAVQPVLTGPEANRLPVIRRRSSLDDAAPYRCAAGPADACASVTQEMDEAVTHRGCPSIPAPQLASLMLVSALGAAPCDRCPIDISGL